VPQTALGTPSDWRRFQSPRNGCLSIPKLSTQPGYTETHQQHGEYPLTRSEKVKFFPSRQISISLVRDQLTQWTLFPSPNQQLSKALKAEFTPLIQQNVFVLVCWTMILETTSLSIKYVLSVAHKNIM